MSAFGATGGGPAEDGAGALGPDDAGPPGEPERCDVDEGADEAGARGAVDGPVDGEPEDGPPPCRAGGADVQPGTTSSTPSSTSATSGRRPPIPRIQHRHGPTAGNGTMNAVTVVHLLRHGEVHNPNHVLYGRLPGFRLSTLGEQQADLAGAYLAQRPIGYLACSPLERARQTAAPLAALTGLTPVLDEHLIEAENKFEGKAVAGGRGLFSDPSNYKLFLNPIRPSWGEPYKDIAARMHLAVRAARDAARAVGPDAEAVCVSHQLPIVIARRAARHQRLFHDPRKRNCSLASVTSFRFDGDEIVGVTYAEPAAVLPPGEGAGA